MNEEKNTLKNFCVLAIENFKALDIDSVDFQSLEQKVNTSYEDYPGYKLEITCKVTRE